MEKFYLTDKNLQRVFDPATNRSFSLPPKRPDKKPRLNPATKVNFLSCLWKNSINPTVKNKKGQIWSLDLIIAGVIFMMGIIILFFYAINSNSQSKDQLEEFFYEGNLASELLLSDEDNGILTNGKINQTKLDNFNLLSSQQKKSSLGITNNFYFAVNNTNYGIVNTTSVDNLIQITRLAIYQNKPVKFELFVWR